MKAVHFYKPSVSRWLRSILATTALGCSALAQWPTITLEVPVQAAGHSFELYEGYYYGSSSVFSGLPTYDALTQKFLITAGANGSTWYYPRLWNNTLGIETTVNLGQYDYYNPPASIPVNPPVA